MNATAEPRVHRDTGISTSMEELLVDGERGEAAPEEFLKSMFP